MQVLRQIGERAVHDVGVTVRNKQPHVAACAALLRAHFPDRVHLVMGDSRETVPRFAAESGARFDRLGERVEQRGIFRSHRGFCLFRR